MQENLGLKEWIADNVGEEPDIKPHSLPASHRIVIMIMVAFLFGHLQAYHAWPFWTHYFIVGGLSFILGLTQGLWAKNERWHVTAPNWHPLLRRIAGYQAICWTTGLVLFLFGFDSLHSVQHFVAFLLAALLLSGGVWWAKYLLNTFPCPHCQHPYFGKATKWEFGDSFLQFGLRQWPQTHCQHCNWPLWKATDAP